MKTLKTLIKDAGLNNPKLAKLIGCTPVEIWRLATYPAKGGRKMTPAWAEKIAPHIGVKAHELLFSGDDASPELEPGATVELRGEIGRGLWVKKKDQRAQKSDIPRLNGKYWGYEQYAFQTKNSLSIAQPPGMKEYVICVNFSDVRKEPLNGDLIVIEFTDGEMVERQIFQITKVKPSGGFNLEQVTHIVDNPELTSPLESEKMKEEGVQFSFSDLVIGWIAYT